MGRVRDTIISTFNELWSEDQDADPPELTDAIVLLETGMDSMSFAVFVTMLDDALGFDPFAMDDEAVYPVTFGEFVAFYEKHEPN